MQTEETTIEVLNDLIMVNNDRITGYERAINEAKDLDVDLKATFESMIRESEQYKKELEEKVNLLGASPEKGTSTSGKIYHAWMDVKAGFTGNDRKSILESCEFGEDAAQRAYKAALNPDNELNTDVRELVTDQKESLKNAHDLIKKYRDAHR